MNSSPKPIENSKKISPKKQRKAQRIKKEKRRKRKGLSISPSALRNSPKRSMT
jgi:hypothetical protein